MLRMETFSPQSPAGRSLYKRYSVAARDGDLYVTFIQFDVAKKWCWIDLQVN